MKRQVLILLTLLSVALGTFASEPADSVARALATYWAGSYKTDQVPAGQMNEFIRGVADQLSSTPPASSEAYMQGASFGRSLTQSLGQLKEYGIEVTPEAIAPYFIELLRGGKPYMTMEEASATLDRAAGIEPDTVFIP
ncbi:MAG: hypothetical protein K2K55_01785, partial [Duncaniella sp.]|nr:hypothetical protein [Duncaniella sp.]